MATYNFKKDGKSDDGQEVTRYLNDGNKLSTLAAGSYSVQSGQHVGPGSLGVLPPNHTYRLNTGNTSGYTLVVS
jgi:hypothetical protein